jgi:hypothetical protein
VATLEDQLSRSRGVAVAAPPMCLGGVGGYLAGVRARLKIIC